MKVEIAEGDLVKIFDDWWKRLASGDHGSVIAVDVKSEYPSGKVILTIGHTPVLAEEGVERAG